MTTTKSPRRVLQYSYLVGLLTLRMHSNKFSRKDFNQPQLFACLVLKEFLRLDYRKTSALLGEEKVAGRRKGGRAKKRWQGEEKVAGRRKGGRNQ